MPRKNYFFLCVFLFFIANCQLAEVHVDCPAGDCEENNQQYRLATPTTFPGYYRLKTKFRGEWESLDIAYGVPNIQNGAIYMNKNQNIDSQLWKIETIGNGNFRLKNKSLGDEKSLEGNGPESPVFGGASFMDNQKNVTGQYWKLLPQSDGYYHLQIQIKADEIRCLEGNQIAGLNFNGASFTNTCSQQIGQLWKIEKVD